ncbi:MAG: hypothetical protein JWO56_3364 [Acidobacteria bacterium]|nr:hypothetical protein [Acidobacteriota bacterium]
MTHRPMLVLMTLFLCATMSGATRGASARGTVTVAALPRAVGTGEAVHARITLGNALPRGAKVIVRLADGRLLGALAPYGRTRDGSTAVQTIAIPTRMAESGRLQLRMEVKERGATTARPATAAEVQKVELVIVPVTN